MVHRFEVCLGWEKPAIWCDTVTFSGQTSNTTTHSAVLNPGSGPLFEYRGTSIRFPAPDRSRTLAGPIQPPRLLRPVPRQSLDSP